MRELVGAMFCSRCGHRVEEGTKFCPACGLDLAVVTPGGPRLSAEPTAELTEADAVKAALTAEYELREELGRGGMAIVYRAMDRQLEREVALKVLPFSLAFDAEFVERFQREARTAARLEHPNIIPIYRVGRSGRVIYFVMKLLRGTSLSKLLEQRGALSPAEIRQLLAQTASALGYAHKHGIVHRDIKPDNIMFDELGHAVVTDFGIAKAASGTRLTGTGMAIGTPHYMSPEQARAQPMDGRSDLYSLGVVGYQCLTGKVPFDGDDAFSIGYKHIMDELPVPPLEAAEARRLFAVLRRMLSKAPEERYQNAEELIGDLEEARPANGTRAADLATAPTMALPAVESARPSAGGRSSQGKAPTATTPTTPVPRTEPRWRGARDARKRKRGGGVLVAAVVVVLLGGGGVGGWYAYQQFIARPSGGGAPAPSDTLNPAVLTLPPVDSAALLARDSAVRADSIREAALPDSGWLTVTGAPAGARFWVDDEPYTTSVIRVGIGSHQLRVRASGYQDYATLVSVAKGDSILQTVALDRAQTANAPAPVQRRPPAARPPAPATQPAATEAGSCASPFEPTYNKDAACFDTPPAATANLVVPLDATVTGQPRPVLLWVQVGADGVPRNVAVAQTPGSDPSFVVLARAFARQQRYQPALKNGQPVVSWFQFRFVPQIR
jgi:serine/threonine-protein kinase